MVTELSKMAKKKEKHGETTMVVTRRGKGSNRSRCTTKEEEQSWLRDSVNDGLVETHEGESDDSCGESTMATLWCGKVIVAVQCGSTSRSHLYQP